MTIGKKMLVETLSLIGIVTARVLLTFGAALLLMFMGLSGNVVAIAVSDILLNIFTVLAVCWSTWVIWYKC